MSNSFFQRVSGSVRATLDQGIEIHPRGLKPYLEYGDGDTLEDPKRLSPHLGCQGRVCQHYLTVSSPACSETTFPSSKK